jgi:hypothetical protein
MGDRPISARRGSRPWLWATGALLLAACGGRPDAVRHTADAPWPGAHWSLDDGAGFEAKNTLTGAADRLEFVFERAQFKPTTDPYWRSDCVRGGCLRFDGYSNSIDTPGMPPEAATRGFTVSAWVAPHAFEWGDGGRNSAVLSQMDPDARTGFTFGVFRHGTWGIRLGLDDALIDFRSDALRVSVDRWSHIAAAVDPEARRVRLYLDGRRVADLGIPGTGRFRVANAPLRVGKHSTPHTVAGIFHFNTFCGLLDEVRATPGAVDDDAIAALVKEDLGDRATAPR